MPVGHGGRPYYRLSFYWDIHGGLVIIIKWESVAEPLGETLPCEHHAECSVGAPSCQALLGLQGLHHEAKLVRGDA